MKKGTAKDNVVQVQKLRARKEILAGTEKGRTYIETDVYYEVKEELKEEAKALFKEVATTHYMDTRDELSELNSILLNLPEYQSFYYTMLSTKDKIDIEEEIMEELAEEIGDTEGYVVVYDKDKVVMIISKEYYKEEIEGNGRILEDYIINSKKLADDEWEEDLVVMEFENRLFVRLIPLIEFYTYEHIVTEVDTEAMLDGCHIMKCENNVIYNYIDAEMEKCIRIFNNAYNQNKPLTF